MNQIPETNIFPMTKEKNIQVGYVRGDTYFSTRSYTRGQIFRAPKYKNSIGLDSKILRHLMAKGIKKVRILIAGYERESFEAEITLKDFYLLSLGEFDFGHGKQYLCPMHNFTRIYPSQKKLLVKA